MQALQLWICLFRALKVKGLAACDGLRDHVHSGRNDRLGVRELKLSYHNMAM